MKTIYRNWKEIRLLGKLCISTTVLTYSLEFLDLLLVSKLVNSITAYCRLSHTHV